MWLSTKFTKCTRYTTGAMYNYIPIPKKSQYQQLNFLILKGFDAISRQKRHCHGNVHRGIHHYPKRQTCSVTS